MSQLQTNQASGNSELPTLIDGETDSKVIIRALKAYFTKLSDLAFPDTISNYSFFPTDILKLKKVFESRANLVIGQAETIITEINERSRLLLSQEFKNLIALDRQWTNGTDPLIFAVIACVDKGIPFEAVVGVDGIMGRTLAGDIDIHFIKSKNRFVASESPLSKRLIHLGRMTNKKTIVEPLIEHIGCGRRGQMLANEFGKNAVPTFGAVFDHIEALQPEFQGSKSNISERLLKLQNMWYELPRKGISLNVTDSGLLPGIILKIAERQALQGLGEFTTVVSPIGIYDKHTGDYILGLDTIDVLTDTQVLKEGGFTPEIITKFIQNKKIFSIKPHYETIAQLLTNTNFKEGAYTYTNLQKNWFEVQKHLVSVTQALWTHYTQKAVQNKPILQMIEDYLKFAYTPFVQSVKDSEERELIKKQLIHQLFHVIAYAYTLNTFQKGNVPGHHIEDHLAVGDHEIGTKPSLPLGQGDLETPSAAEIFTGYSVLLHSTPGETGKPMLVFIKLDTDRSGSEPISTEETVVAQNHFYEFMKLWPYFLAGDIIPIVSIRGKKKGGISRLGLSIVLDFGDIVDLIERERKALPRFVPANNSLGNVVIVPAVSVLQTAIETGNDLKAFRKKMITVADTFSNPDLQEKLKEEFK